MGWLDEPVVGFDLETTGPDPTTAQPVQVAMVLRNGQHGSYEQQKYLVQQEGTIPAGAAAVHGITDEQCATEGIAAAEAAVQLHNDLVTAKSLGYPIVGMNLVYDLTVADRFIARHLGANVADVCHPRRCVDLLVLDRHVDRFRRGGRKLVDLAKHYGVPPFEAHDALADVTATLDVVEALVAKYPRLGVTPIDKLHGQQQQWRREWATSYAEYRETRGQSPLEPEAWLWPIIPRDLANGADEPGPRPKPAGEIAGEALIGAHRRAFDDPTHENLRLLEQAAVDNAAAHGRVFPRAEVGA